MIYLFQGLPGSGKSYNAVRWLLDEHYYYERVYTNIEFNMVLLRDKYPDLAKKISFLTADDIENLGQFRDGNCVIVIDEIHVYFNSREWQKRNKDFMVFLTQHRKQGIDLVAITQDVKNIDSQMRRLIGVVYSCVNASQLELFIFRLPNLFIVKKTMSGVKAGTEFVLFRKSVGALYDSFARVDVDDDGMVKAKRKLPLMLRIRRFFVWSKLARWVSYVLVAFIVYHTAWSGSDARGGSGASRVPVKSTVPANSQVEKIPGQSQIVNTDAVFKAFDSHNVCTGIIRYPGKTYILYKVVDGLGNRHDKHVLIGFGSHYVIKDGYLLDDKEVKICDVRGFI